MNRVLFGILLGVLTVALCSTAPGAVFVLGGGGRVTGELLNPDESPRQKYLIQTDHGRIALDKAQVEQVLYPSAAESEYERIRSSYPDTADGQWKLSAWCQEHNLNAQRRTHLERVIELSPDHLEARRLLGYQKHEGQWLTGDEVRKSRGLIYFRGKYLTPQEKEIIQKNEKATAEQKDWAVKIKRWRDWLETDRDQAARESFQAIQDPQAVQGLTKALATDTRYKPKTVYIEALARLGTPDAIQTLAVTSLNDPVEEVRLTCLDYLKQKKRPEVVAYYVSKLRDKNNAIVNQAAVGLRAMNDTSAIRPLIEALVTKHTRVINTGGGPGSISTTFGSGAGGGGGGLAVGGGPKVEHSLMRNQRVLDALIAITGGVNFDFDVRAWSAWYSSRRAQPVIDARRSDKPEVPPAAKP